MYFAENKNTEISSLFISSSHLATSWCDIVCQIIGQTSDQKFVFRLAERNTPQGFHSLATPASYAWCYSGIRWRLCEHSREKFMYLTNTLPLQMKKNNIEHRALTGVILIIPPEDDYRSRSQ